MFSFKKLFGKEDVFFGLLAASAQEAHDSVQALVKLCQGMDQPAGLEEIARARRKDKEITTEIRTAIHTAFATALEREDIDALARALYRIPKTVEKFVDRVQIVPLQVKGVDFSQQIPLLKEATECVLQLVQSLCRGINLEEVQKWNDRLQHLESEGDKAMIVIYRNLFDGQHDPLRVLILKDLYEMLEKVIDRCRDVGNVISQIVLKNS